MIKYKADLLLNVLDGLPDTIIRLIIVGTKRDNSTELKSVLQQYENRKYSDLGEYLLPETFPDDARDNLYQIRCSGLLGIYMFLNQSSISSFTRQQKLERLLMRCVTTMDSYAVSSVLLKAASYMMLVRPYISGNILIQKTLQVLESIKDERIDRRIDIQEGIGEMINIYKEIQIVDTRKGVKKEELLQSLREIGIY